MKRTLLITRNVNGWASSTKDGPVDSFSYSRHIDFRKDPRLITVLPGPTKETGDTVTGLVTEMIQLPSGKIVAIDMNGAIYTRTTGGVWAKSVSSFSSFAYGMVYNNQQDTIYASGTSSIHSIANADGKFGGVFTPNTDFLGTSIDQSATDNTNNYTTLNFLQEDTANRLSITPTIEPLYSVRIWITALGTGDLTVTMHDAANNTLGTRTLTVANLNIGTLNEFVITPSPRMLVKPNAGTYHFHVTHASSGTASTIGVATSGNLSTARFESYGSRLVSPVNGFHPMYEFLQYYLILNERYVATWEPISAIPSNTEFLRHRLTLPPGYEGTSACQIDEYFVIGAEKRSTSATNEFQQGKLFFWDGTAVTYNRVVNVPEGAPYTLFSQGNIAYYFANGKWWAIGSTGNPAPIFQMPGTDFEFTDLSTYMVNYPHSMTVRNGMLLGGFPSETNSSTMEHAIYSFGRRNKNYDQSFGYSYSISSGTNTGSGMRLGTVKSYGDKLFYSWKDGNNYGIDKVDPNSDPFPTSTWESLIIDNKRPDKTKEAVSLRITFKALPVGATVTPKYSIDRAAYVSDKVAAAGDTEVLLPINKRYKEIQLAYDTTQTTITPEIISVALVWETLEEEAD